MSISLRSGDEEALFGGDIMHLPIQVYRPDWSSVFSASPERGRLSRLWALERAAERGAIFSARTSPEARPDWSNVIATGSVGVGFEVIPPILSWTRTQRTRFFLSAHSSRAPLA